MNTLGSITFFSSAPLSMINVSLSDYFRVELCETSGKGRDVDYQILLFSDNKTEEGDILYDLSYAEFEGISEKDLERNKWDLTKIIYSSLRKVILGSIASARRTEGAALLTIDLDLIAKTAVFEYFKLSNS